MNTGGIIYMMENKKKPLKKIDHESGVTDFQDTKGFWSPIMVVDYIAGLLGGAAGVIVGHPFDTVKVHLQTDDPRNPKYKGTLHCFKSILVKYKLRGLYRGISSPMAGIGAVNAIVFGVYGNVQRFSENPNSLWSHCLAGSLAGIAQSFVCAPMELAKTRLQLSTNIDAGVKFKGPLDCLRYVLRTEGIRAVFKGLLATTLRDIPGFSMYFVSYEFLMGIKEKPNIPYTLMAGGCAGMCSWLACYPVDVVKTHMQADGLGKDAKYSGFFDCAKQGFRREGTYFFFRGLNSTLVRAFPMNAACFFVVSWVMDFAKKSSIDMVVHSNQPFNLMNLDNISQAYLHHKDPIDDEVVRKIIIENAGDISTNGETKYDSIKDVLNKELHGDEYVCDLSTEQKTRSNT